MYWTVSNLNDDQTDTCNGGEKLRDSSHEISSRAKSGTGATLSKNTYNPPTAPTEIWGIYCYL